MQYLVLIFATLFSSVAEANAGIPVVSFGLPFMVLNLVFVVLIETAVVKSLRRDLDFVGIAPGVFVANLITTLIGYPVVAILAALTAVFGMNLGWILPFSELEQMNFYVSTAMFVTLVPSYFLSVWLEGKWLKRHRIPSRAVWIANLASYIFLSVQIYLMPPMFLIGFGKYTFETSYVVIMKLANLFMTNQ